MQTGWLELDGKKYYLNSDGAMVSNNWTLEYGKWYFFDADGVMQTGWLNRNDKWYFLNTDGSMAVNTVTPDGYTLDENGVWVK